MSISDSAADLSAVEAEMFATLAVLAAVCFAVGGYFTKLSHGLTARGPTAVMFALFLAGSALQAAGIILLKGTH